MNTSIASMRSALANKAKELTTLRAENERLREALKSIAGTGGESNFRFQRDHMRGIAVQALKEGEE